MSDIKVGSTVQITDVGFQYTTYRQWAERNGVSNYKDLGRAKQGDEGVVVAKAVHSPDVSFGETGKRMLFAVRVNGNDFIFDDRGIKEIIPKWICNGIQFEAGDLVEVIAVGKGDDPDGMGEGRKWVNCTVPRMDSAIGKQFTISAINKNGAQFDGLGWPLNVLRNLTKQPRANGVDEHGNELNLTVDDLKVNQRIVTKNGRKAIIATEDNGNKVIIYEGDGWDDARLDDSYFSIVEVYDRPRMPNLFNQSSRGQLVWKQLDVAKEAKRKVAQAEYDKAVARAKEAGSAAEAARKALEAI